MFPIPAALERGRVDPSKNPIIAGPFLGIPGFGTRLKVISAVLWKVSLHLFWYSTSFQPVSLPFWISGLIYCSLKHHTTTPPPRYYSSTSRVARVCTSLTHSNPQAWVHQYQMHAAAAPRSHMRRRAQLAAECHMMLWRVSCGFAAIGWAWSFHVYNDIHLQSHMHMRHLQSAKFCYFYQWRWKIHRKILFRWTEFTIKCICICSKLYSFINFWIRTYKLSQ